MATVHKKIVHSRRVGSKRDARGNAVVPETNLTLYLEPPENVISLEDFEKVALNRLALLKDIESLKEMDVKGLELQAGLRESIKKYMPIEKFRKDVDSTERKIQLRNDMISHFILRLAVSESEETRRWFIKQELALFKSRFDNEDISGRKAFLETIHRDTKLKYSPVEFNAADREVNQLYDKVRLAAGIGLDKQGEEFYAVPFEEVIDLVRQRRVFIKGGQAFVPKTALISILMGLFRARLAQNLLICKRILPSIKEDERTAPLLNHLSSHYADVSRSKFETGPVGSVTPDMIDELCETMFPMCMRSCHKTLRKDHHMKHHARMQYGLFIKGIGLSLDDSLRFWKAEFSKGVGADKFERSYAYNIRHNYGKEGKRTDYTPYGCMQIITGNVPGPNEPHGCPFRSWNADRLTASLTTHLTNLRGGAGGVTPIVNEIVTKAKDHPQIACRMHFGAMHPETPQVLNVGNHPNTFFSEGMRLVGGAPDARYVKGEEEKGGACVYCVANVFVETKEDTPVASGQDS